MYQHIMLPLDGSELSLKAADEGIGLAKVMGAKLTLITVVTPYQTHVTPAVSLNQVIDQRHDEEARQLAQKMQANVVSQAKSKGVQCEGMVVVRDNPYREIIDNAVARKCDLIVMASHGRRGIGAVLIGSETAKVLTHSKIPVLVVRP